MLQKLRRHLRPEERRPDYPAPKNVDLSTWESRGYLHLRRFFSPDTVANLRAELDRLWAERSAEDNPYVIDVFIGTPDERRVSFRTAPDRARKHPYKLNDLFLDNRLVQNAILDESLTRILRFLLQAEPVVCNTLTFEYGSQQRLHFDTFYMPPATPNQMLATWIALDPVQENNGPLVYVPESHKIEPYLFSSGTTHAKLEEMPAFDRYIDAELDKRSLKPVTLAAEPGDVFIWHAQLYHGGAPINDLSLTRRSIVTHYFSTRDVGEQNREDLGGRRFIMRRSHQPARDWTG